jgi:hypothetical protein
MKDKLNELNTQLSQVTKDAPLIETRLSSERADRPYGTVNTLVRESGPNMGGLTYECNFKRPIGARIEAAHPGSSVKPYISRVSSGG